MRARNLYRVTYRFPERGPAIYYAGLVEAASEEEAAADAKRRQGVDTETDTAEWIVALVWRTASAWPNPAGHWDLFNWEMILKEARMRLEQARANSSKNITPEMLTLEYWCAHVAHTNAAHCFMGLLPDHPAGGGAQPGSEKSQQ